jgi:uncharacterized protein (TIGR03000 family)
MHRKTHILGCILVLSVAAILATPGYSQARGGGRGGGGHFGGAHAGGYHTGAYHGATHLGGYRFGGYGVGSVGSHFPYGGHSYSSPYFDNIPNYVPGDAGYYGTAPLVYGDATYGTPPEAYQALYPPPVTPPSLPTQSGSRAHITVSVPADAEVWFDDTAMTPTGTVRQFKSPPLAPGNYSYQIRARWNESGHEVTQTQQVQVAPGAHVSVSFPITPQAQQASAAHSG